VHRFLAKALFKRIIFFSKCNKNPDFSCNL